MKPGSALAAACLASLAILLALAATAASADALGAGKEKAVRAATFEVVMRRAETDPLSYERALPLDLLPFSVRNDPYLPIGTAFAIGNNQFVTAAHVLLVSVGSLYEGPLLRSADGEVYPVASILKYSAHEDFAVLGVEAPPRVRPLAVNRSPAVNAPVHAVGNALGGGIVIRGGLFTSRTPEDLAGRWEWLRFSAAASPGNSGGPLLDEAGRVIGVIVAASPNENLNFALPIGRVMDAPADRATFDIRVPFARPFAPWAVTHTLRADLPLPRSPAAFAAELLELLRREDANADARWMESYGARVFPDGPGSDRLLRRVDPPLDALRTLQVGRGGEWESVPVTDQYKVPIAGGGEIRAGGVPAAALLEVRLPQASSVADILSDPAEHGALLASGLRLTRFVGAESVDIVSLGQAAVEHEVRDNWGRKWLARTWSMPFADLQVLSLTMPVPDGLLVLGRLVPPKLAASAYREMASVAGLTQPVLRGNLRQWREFLALSGPRSPPFDSMTLDASTEKGFTLRSRRMSLEIGPEVWPVTEESDLEMNCRYGAFDGPVEWDCIGLRLASVRRSNHAVVVNLLQPPLEDDPAGQRAWKAILDGEELYSGLQFVRDGVRFANQVLPVGGEPGAATGDVKAVWLIGLAVAREDASEQEFDSRFAELVRGFEIKSP